MNRLHSASGGSGDSSSTVSNPLLLALIDLVIAVDKSPVIRARAQERTRVWQAVQAERQRLADEARF